MKSILRSKTFWVNVMTFIGAVLDQVMSTGLIPAEALAVLSVVNIGLRAITSTPVTALPGR